MWIMWSVKSSLVLCCNNFAAAAGTQNQKPKFGKTYPPKKTKTCVWCVVGHRWSYPGYNELRYNYMVD